MLKIRTILLLCVCFLFHTACEDNNYFSIKNEYVKGHTSIFIIDTCSVALSTVIGDTVITSSKGIGWVGKYNDNELGLSEASTYFGLTLPTMTVEKRIRFDSITIIMTPNGNYYGDTTVNQQIDIYQLASILEYDKNDRLHNTSVVGTEATPIHSISFRSRPGNKEPIERRLPDTFGQTLFDLFVNQAPEVETAAKFERYFKGLALKAAASNNCMMGYNIVDTNFIMRIHYQVVTDERERRTLDFKPVADKQYYRLTADRTGTDLESLSAKYNDKMSSTETNNRSYIQSATILQTEITFPHINNILTMGRYGRIISAYLYLRPIRDSYGDGRIPLPPTLNLYVKNYSGNTVDLALDRSGAAQTGNLVLDNAERYETYYIFDVTAFLQAQLGAGGIDVRTLLLTVPSSELTTTVQRLIIGDAQNKKHSSASLKIEYSVYTGDN